MLGTIPFGGIAQTGQSTGLLLTSGSATKFTFNGASNTVNTNTREGDPAVIPDQANSRIQVNAPGVYKVRFECYGTVDGAMNIAAEVRKTVNGTQTAVSGVKGITYFPATNKGMIVVEGYVETLASDLPAAGGGSTFSDPSASAGAGKPQGGFAGAGAAPKTGVYIDVQLTSDATQTLTASDARLSVERMG